MWEDEGSDFGGQCSGESNMDSLALSHSELMYGTFADPAACGNGAWAEPQYSYQHYQQQTSDGDHQQHHHIAIQQEEEEAARAAANIEANAVGDANSEGAAQHQAVYYTEAPESASPAQQCLLAVPELSSWWHPEGRAAPTSASNHSWAAAGAQHQQQFQQQQHHHHQQHQPMESMSEREFIIVRKAKGPGIGGVGALGWDGGASAAGAETSVVYECRLCGRQCRWRSSISVHVRTHTGRKPYQCRVCLQRFADSSTRKKHEKKTHGCVIPSIKKAVGLEAPNLSPQHPHQQQQQQQQQQHAGVATLSCHLCFVMLPTETELTKHLYEFHNHLAPEFSETFEEAAEVDVAAFAFPGRIKQQPSESNFMQQQMVEAWPGRILTGFDNSDELHHQQQNNQGIPLPSVPQKCPVELDQNIGSAVDHHGNSQANWRGAGVNAMSAAAPDSAADLGGGGTGDHHHMAAGTAQDAMYPYEIGCLGRDLHGIENILEDGRLTSYNQHLEFDKLDW